MADSPDALLLKRRARRRLVGAIALVVLIVVILPVILDQQPRTVTQPLTVQIPGQEARPFNAPVLPPLQPPRAASRKKESAQPAGKKPGDTGAPEAPGPDAADKERARAGDDKRAKVDVAETRRAKALVRDEVYVVPLGAFIHPENARQVRDKAASAGIKSYTETIKSPRGERTRVRAGPFATPDIAEKARQKLKSLGIEVGQVAQR